MPQSLEAAKPTHLRRTMNPPGKPSPHASGSPSASASASVSRTHEEEPGSIPMHLGSFGSQAVAPGPEGRQTVAQRVSAGWTWVVGPQPQRGDRTPPFPRSFAPPGLDSFRASTHGSHRGLPSVGAPHLWAGGIRRPSAGTPLFSASRARDNMVHSRLRVLDSPPAEAELLNHPSTA